MTTRMLLPLALTGALIAGCGGGKDPLSKEEFAKQGNALCDKYEKKVEAIPQPKTAKDVQTYVDKIKPLVSDITDEFRAIEPPEDFAADFDKYIDQTTESAKLVDDLAAAAKAKDLKKLQAVQKEAVQKEEATDSLARKLGLTKCAAD